jgi:signal transduction histidine kinase
MTGSYAYTPAIWPPLAAALFLFALGLYSWRRCAVPAALPLAAGSLFGALSLLGMAFGAAAVDPAAKIAWHKFEIAWQLPAVTATTCFALEYTVPGRWLTRRNLTLLALPVLLLVLLLLTNDAQLVWRRLEVAAGGLVLTTPAAPGMIVLAYGMGLVLVNTAAFLWLFIRSPEHRWPVALMLFGEIAGRILYLEGLASRPAARPIDPTITAFLVVWAMYAIALFGFRIFDPLPAARRSVIEQMQTGVVVFDAARLVVSLNPAAERLLGVRTGAARGRRWRQLALPSGGPLPDLPDPGAAGASADDAVELPEMTIGSGPGARVVAPALSSLRDYRGLLMGHLLLLLDVTEQKRAQAQILEQQRWLATLHEREQLARDLHDGIGQVLGYAGFQVGAARRLIADGQTHEAEAQLARLASALHDAHVDVRQQIVDLRAAPGPHKPFFEVVRHYLAAFSSNYDLRTELKVGGELGEDPFPSEVQMQLFRILQEALSNARKHSGAGRVEVAFCAHDGALRMSIEDDGCGFDPELAAAAGGSHFGLDFMAERAAELGGRLRVEPAAGHGTRVVVEV